VGSVFLGQQPIKKKKKERNGGSKNLKEKYIAGLHLISRTVDESPLYVFNTQALV
jgi:hypothetical protein